MAVKLEFLNIIVPIKNINRVYKGGFEQLKKDYADIIGNRVWFDDHLLRDGAMNPYDMMQLISYWEAKGLNARKVVDDKENWHEMCVVDTLMGPTLPCSWVQHKSSAHEVIYVD